MSGSLSPFVYWAQNEKDIFLKIELKDAKDPDICLEEKQLKFSANGQGAKGIHQYSFSIDFHSPVNPEVSSYKINDSKIEFTITKAEAAWWSRVTAQPQKPAWLKVDFDRWQSEDDVNDLEARDVTQDYPDLYDKLLKTEYGYTKEDYKKVYLVIYNLGMFVGFLYICTVMGVRYFRDGANSMQGTYQAVGPAFCFLQILQFLEVLHPIFGYTKGGVFNPLMQVCGRNFILLALIDSEPRMQDKPVIFYLFAVWASVELVRYPYYITQVYKRDVGIITWLRYTIWIPLYPMGFLCEGIVALRCIPYFEETKRFVVELPNAWNFAFYFPTLLRIYLLFFILPGMYALMTHMYKMRCKKLGPKSWKKSN